MPFLFFSKYIHFSFFTLNANLKSPYVTVAYLSGGALVDAPLPECKKLNKNGPF